MSLHPSRAKSAPIWKRRSCMQLVKQQGAHRQHATFVGATFVARLGMPNGIEARAEFLKAQQREKETFDRAVSALQEAARTKQLRLYAWIALAEIRRSEANVTPLYGEFMYLRRLEDQATCRNIVQKALSGGFWSRLLYSLVHRT